MNNTVQTSDVDVDLKISELVVGELKRWRNDRNPTEQPS